MKENINICYKDESWEGEEGRVESEGRTIHGILMRSKVFKEELKIKNINRGLELEGAIKKYNIGACNQEV